MFFFPFHQPRTRAGKTSLFFSREYLHRTLGEDREILDRILAAYHHGKENAPEKNRLAMWGPLWTEKGYAGRQGALVDALENRSVSRLHHILSRYFLDDASLGIAMGRKEKDFQEQNRDGCEDGYRALLVGLAQMIGALPVPYPEIDPETWKDSLGTDPQKVFEAIEERLGMELSFPDVCGAYGLCLHGRPFNGRSFTHVLAAWHIRSLLTAEKPVIAEIGGGFGGLAYFTARLVPAAHYTIFDLPFMNAVQAYFLHRALPDWWLVLAGESAVSTPALTVLPAWNLWDLPPDYRAHLAVNQDSLPEISQQTACLYLEALKTFLDGPFLSINREANTGARDQLPSVQKTIEKVGGFRCLNRSHFSLRPGYVQEIYLLTRHVGAFIRPQELQEQADRVGALYVAARRKQNNPVKKLLRLLKNGFRIGFGKLVRS